jgi:hypothetical protein
LEQKLIASALFSFRGNSTSNGMTFERYVQSVYKNLKHQNIGQWPFL